MWLGVNAKYAFNGKCSFLINMEPKAYKSLSSDYNNLSTKHNFSESYPDKL